MDGEEVTNTNKRQTRDRHNKQRILDFSEDDFQQDYEEEQEEEEEIEIEKEGEKEKDNEKE